MFQTASLQFETKKVNSILKGEVTAVKAVSVLNMITTRIRSIKCVFYY